MGKLCLSLFIKEVLRLDIGDPIRKSGVFCFYDISGSERVDEAAGLGNQSRHKGSVVRGFEPHLPEVVRVKLPARGDYCTIERLTKNLTSSLT